MLDWWDKNGPPVYVSVAAYLGLIKVDTKGKPVKSTGNKSSGGLDEIFKFAGPGGMIH